ncbi:MAG: IPT/TIG domain-containing protein [candidate division Zixibacteria bacterium]|nr:IPT/TIG domain-containing protein [candidate division Zixibacteria bacterium]
MRLNSKYRSYFRISAALAFLVVFTPLGAYAQGSIFGTVQNSDLTFPANGQVSFFGFLDNADAEIRIETSTGAGYDNGNWFDDFQNYLTEAPGNPYDYYFTNAFVSQGFHLAKLIPNNSFQQENVLLAPVSWPAQPAGLTGFAVSATTVEISWSAQPGVTYHVYRRFSVSNGSLFRIDDPTGSLANPGVSGNFFVDATVNGISSYDYAIIGEDALGNYSQHSAILTVNSAIITAPVVFSINPASGVTLGGTTVNIFGDGFDLGGVNALVGGSPLTGVTVLSPKHITGVTAPGAAGPADVFVVNLASALSSNTLVGGFVYTVNDPPVLAPIGAKTLVEGGVLSFTATATDIDGGIPIMAASPLPSGATFVDNGDGTGSFSWPTNFFDAATLLT